MPKSLSYDLLKFRLRNVPLPGASFFAQRPDSDIKCPLCDSTVCDEFHLILVCKYFNKDRSWFPVKYRYTKNTETFYELMNNSHISTDLGKLVKKIN